MHCSSWTCGLVLVLGLLGLLGFGGARKLPARRFHKFVSRPDIYAPIWVMGFHEDKEHPIARGSIFVSFYANLDQPDIIDDVWDGPYIYDTAGRLIWSGATAFKHWNVFDFDLAHTESGDVLTLISEHFKTAFILDNSYQVLQKVSLLANDEYTANMHEFHVVDNGKRALALDLHPGHASKRDSARLGYYRSQCLVIYDGFREFDLENPGSAPLFEWDVRPHISVSESDYMGAKPNVTAMCNDGWDLFHLNSLDKFPNGDYLVSARHTSAVYRVNHTDGSIIWRLGGNKSDFKFEGNSTFSRQHHARLRSHNDTHTVITLFDNACGDDEHPTHDYSRGLVLSLDTEAMIARLLFAYPHPDQALTKARGSFQTLGNGNVFLNWANGSRISEYAPDGKLLMKAQLGVDVDTYRAFRYEWVGKPTQPPDLVSQAVYDNFGQILTMAYMSWNGATEVYHWELHEVNEKGEVKPIGGAHRWDFETRVVYHGFKERVLVRAKDRDRNLIGESRVVRTAPPTELGVDYGFGHLQELEEAPRPGLDGNSSADDQQGGSEKMDSTAPEETDPTASEETDPKPADDAKPQDAPTSAPDDQLPADDRLTEQEDTEDEEDSKIADGYSMLNGIPTNNSIGLATVIVSAGVAAVVGLILGLLMPRISQRWRTVFTRRKNVRYDRLGTDEEAEDVQEEDVVKDFRVGS